MAKKSTKTKGSSWSTYTRWLEEHAHRAFANLAPPARASDLRALEKAIGQKLPEGVRGLLVVNDGQRRLEACTALPGLRFLSCAHILREWKSWASLRKGQAKHLDAHDAHCRSLAPGVRAVYTDPGWIPLFQDEDRADYFGVDLAPEPKGKRGQIINFGRDETDHFVAFDDVEDFIRFWLKEAQAGRCKVVEAAAGEGADELRHRKGNSIDVLRPRVKPLSKAQQVAEAKKLAAKLAADQATAKRPLTITPSPDRDRGPRYPEMDALHRALLKRLAADKRKAPRVAGLWHQGPAPRQTSTSGGGLRHHDLRGHLAAVPWPQAVAGSYEEDPASTACSEFLVKHGKSKTGPYLVTFHYERSGDGRWSGDYAIETRAQHAQVAKGRERFDEGIFAALRVLIGDGVESAAVNYSWSDAKDGPRLTLLHRNREPAATFHPLTGGLLAAWNALVTYLQSQGAQRLVYVAYSVSKPNPRAGEQLRHAVLYGR